MSSDGSIDHDVPRPPVPPVRADRVGDVARRVTTATPKPQPLVVEEPGNHRRHAAFCAAVS